MDSLTYHYASGKNQLGYVDDDVPAQKFPNDIDDQESDNYDYNAIGQLIKDTAEDISTIDWTLNGKVKDVQRYSGSTKPNLTFDYDATGNRVKKFVKNGSLPTNWKNSYYIRDAQGNILAVYEKTYEDSVAIDPSNYNWMIDSLQNQAGTSSLSSFIVQYYATGSFADDVKDTLEDMSKLDDVVRLGRSYYENISGFKEYLLKSMNAADLLDSVVVLDRDLLDFMDQGELLKNAIINYCSDILDSVEAIDPSSIPNIHAQMGLMDDPMLTMKQEICQASPGRELELANDIISAIGTSNVDDLLFNQLTDMQFFNILQTFYNLTGLRNELLDFHLSDVYGLLDSDTLDDLYDNLSDGELYDFLKDYDLEEFIDDAITEDFHSIIPALRETEPQGRYFLEKVLAYFGSDTYQYLRSFFPYQDFMERFKLKEVMLYGSNRLGTFDVDTTIKAKRFKGSIDTSTGELEPDSVYYYNVLTLDSAYFSRILGKKRYELTNHLGNVMVTISDKKTAVASGNPFIADYYLPDIKSA